MHNILIWTTAKYNFVSLVIELAVLFQNQVIYTYWGYIPTNYRKGIQNQVFIGHMATNVKSFGLECEI